jgi:hypothetical protein
MKIDDILLDIHSLETDLIEFERKYGIRSETFFEAYSNGEEPENDSWVLDFSEWASVYSTWLRRQVEYSNDSNKPIEKYEYIYSK